MKKINNNPPVTLGRYAAPDYIYHIRKQFEEHLPDSVPKDYIIDQVLRYFVRYVKSEMIEGRSVTVIGFGKFHRKAHKIRSNAPNAGSIQYYPKFNYTRSYIRAVRKALGTLSECDEAVLAEKAKFISTVWAKRKAATPKDEA
jgi:nucleoid DNA-binding protein